MIGFNKYVYFKLQKLKSKYAEYKQDGPTFFSRSSNVSSSFFFHLYATRLLKQYLTYDILTFSFALSST